MLSEFFCDMTCACSVVSRSPVPACFSKAVVCRTVGIPVSAVLSELAALVSFLWALLACRLLFDPCCLESCGIPGSSGARCRPPMDHRAGQLVAASQGLNGSASTQGCIAITTFTLSQARSQYGLYQPPVPDPL